MSSARPRPISGPAVADEIRDRILTGVYPPGFHLRETTVAADLNISRTPVREAFRRLAADGLVDLYPNRGARVAGWSQDELEQILSLRVLLESYAARLAATRIGAAGISRLEELADRMDAEAERPEGPDHDHVASLNNDFHAIILAATGNERLISIVSSLVNIPLVHRTFLRYSEADLRRSFANHRELIDAFHAQDEAWAEAVMRTHLLAARRVLMTLGDSEDEVESE